MKDNVKKKIVRWFWGLFIAGVLAVVGLLAAVWAFADIPSFEELENPDSKLATQVISSDGEILTTFHIENRSFVNYSELSPNLVNAAVATEDVRFYNHSGIDFKSLGRVIFKTLLGGDSSQGGGSTITQQLAKTLYPREDVSSRIPGVSTLKMVWIKLKEWITAVKLERNYTKDEIMNMYMNQIFFGSNAYGIKAAAQTFFGKNPIDLTVEESATLVGMVNKPTRYNPALNPDKSLTRRNFVISQMEKAGFISEHERDSIQQIPITLSYQIQDHNAGVGPYFRDMLRRTMNAKEPKRSSYNQYEDYKVDSLLWADDQLYGWLNKNRKADGTSYNLDKDGLRIYTTIDSRMQRYAEEAVAELDSLCGLEQVKRDVKSLINLVKVRRLRQEAGLPVPPMSLHLVFMGNPGTGKTTVARLLAKIYHAIGVLSKGQLVEVDRSGLVAGFVGQTALKTQEVVQKAIGGVLFIDEAYALVNQENGNDFGHEAIEVILKNMEDHRDDLIVIVAGYINLMEKFIRSNPGLESRFNKYFYFEDYEADQLMDIFRSMCQKNGYSLSKEAEGWARADFKDLYESRDENFGNAREVRNLFEKAVARQADRVALLETPTREQLMELRPEDLNEPGETPEN